MKSLTLTLALLCGAALAQTTTPTTAPTTPAQTTPATPAAPATTPSTTAAPADPTAVVGIVGGEKFTAAQFEQAFSLAVARVLNAQGVPYEAEYNSEFADARPAFLTQFLRDRAIYQLAQRATKVDAATVDAQVADAKKDFKDDAEFTDALKGSGYTDEAQFRAELLRRATVNAYLGDIQGRYKFGDAIVAGYYNLNRVKFNRAAQACARHILVPTQAEAQAIVKSIQGGQDFAKVAADKSQDPGSAQDGGDLGCFGKGQMVAPFETAVFAGPLNTLQTVQTQFGWHVIQVTKRTDAGLTPLAEAAPVIRDQLSREGAQKYVDSQVARLNIQAFPAVVTVAAPTTATPATTTPATPAATPATPTTTPTTPSTP